MVDVDKLDSIIEELDGSSKKIIKLPQIIKDTEHLISKTNESYDLLNSLVKVINETNEKSLLSTELCEKAYKAIDDYCIRSSEANAKFISNVNTILLGMKNENTDLYKNFETTITSKFDLLKSDIVVENRKITSEITEVIGEKGNLLKAEVKNSIKESSGEVLSKLNDKIDNKSKLLTTLICTSIVISMVGLVIQYLR